MNTPALSQQRFAIPLLILIFLSVSVSVLSQNPAYKLYNGQGKKVKYQKMVNAASGADVVLFGELHNNPISHWLQLELTTDLFNESGKDVILGAEMFESDNQLILDEYLEGWITETKFEEEARLWRNYKTDYKPLVLLAKDEEIPFIATNIPRRYANSVFKRGVAVLDSISDLARGYIAPLPLEYDTSLNCYSVLIHGGGGGGMPGHGSVNLADAQAIKDATMSHFILENWEPGKLFIHYNGAYHSDNYESMNWFLKRDLPELKIVTISTVSQDTISKLEEEAEGKADFIIAVPSNMTTTY